MNHVSVSPTDGNGPTQGEDCENMTYMLKKYICFLVLSLNFRGKLGEISLFKIITLISDCFLLTLGENTIMFVSPH